MARLNEVTTPAPDSGSRVDAASFRAALGHFCTGVTVITAVTADGVPAGFACQSFTALSLEPPLVLFCPSRASRTWPVIEASAHFCVNVLAHSQQEVSAVFGSGSGDKFTAVDWRTAPSGAPVLAGALAWIDCDVHAVHDGGDHHVVIGRVRTVGESRPERPLLFHRGSYTVTAEPVTSRDAAGNFTGWFCADDWI
jgi:3-hydroxy-9,10-secoandrosta-1,3,5(10)-triene-9,17-dione monooxygenase reductase component